MGILTQSSQVMVSTDPPPEDLSERELFTEYVDLLEQNLPNNGHTKTEFKQRRISLLSEIGNRLEELEAAKALLCDGSIEQNQNEPMPSDTSADIEFDDE